MSTRFTREVLATVLSLTPTTVTWWEGVPQLRGGTTTTQRPFSRSCHSEHPARSVKKRLGGGWQLPVPPPADFLYLETATKPVPHFLLFLMLSSLSIPYFLGNLAWQSRSFCGQWDGCSDGMVLLGNASTAFLALSYLPVTSTPDSDWL